MIAKIKEVKEWFVRLTSVSTGQLRDRETTFSKQYPVTAGDLAGLYKMFLKEGIPSEDVFKKLFNSLTFVLNPEDTAFEKQQGLVQKATDVKSISRDSRDNIQLDGLGSNGISQDTEITSDNVKYLTTTNFTTAVIPHQLPNIHCLTTDPDGLISSVNNEVGNGISVDAYTVALTGLHAGKSRKNFRIKANVDDVSIQIIDDKLETTGVTDTLTVVTSVSYDGNGAVTGVTTSDLTIVKGVITNIN